MPVHGAPHPTHRSLNWVWDIGLLDWVMMQQPILNAGTVTVDLTGTGLAKDATLLLRHIYEIDYVGGSNPTYIGLAVPGTATSTAAWQIRKLTFDGSNNVTSILFAGGSFAYTAIWDNRAALSYS